MTKQYYAAYLEVEEMGFPGEKDYPIAISSNKELLEKNKTHGVHVAPINELPKKESWQEGAWYELPKEEGYVFDNPPKEKVGALKEKGIKKISYQKLAEKVSKS